MFKSLLSKAEKIAKNFAENEKHYQNILKIVLNQPDKNGKTILFYIVLNKSIEMLKLLKKFSKVDSKGIFNALFILFNLFLLRVVTL